MWAVQALSTRHEAAIRTGRTSGPSRGRAAEHGGRDVGADATGMRERYTFVLDLH
ncbi:hypothetical protein HMPREF1979_02657 [Actinomyces johnsonii F0542]|uniref:Uncharacterized protein n=1 Tax=Actinomyces johnsonii F0542 TaxID=1321818 RepID=U1Q350_9ACTO|nr:hypothetical protein HMPREF1979_02657 [Actinomyces johnsonii F0542]